MIRRALPLLALAAFAAPSVAAAQVWPAAGASGASRMEARQDRAALATARTAAWAREQAMKRDRRVLLKLTTNVEARDRAPAVDLEPKAEWLDDQGLRVTPTRLAYKQKF